MKPTLMNALQVHASMEYAWITTIDLNVFAKRVGLGNYAKLNSMSVKTNHATMEDSVMIKWQIIAALVHLVMLEETVKLTSMNVHHHLVKMVETVKILLANTLVLVLLDFLEQTVKSAILYMDYHSRRITENEIRHLWWAICTMWRVCSVKTNRNLVYRHN